MSARIPRIISVDDHVIEPADLWTTWLPRKFQDSGPRVQRLPYELVSPDHPDIHLSQRHFPCKPAASGPTTDFWVYEDWSFPVGHKAIAAAGLSPEEIDFEPIGYDQMRRGFYDPTARLQDMDANHVERSLCFPTFPRFCGQRFWEAKDKDVALACVRAYNDWMVEGWCGDSGGRLIPLCLIPLWDPAEAAREVKRNAERGVRAVTFCELPKPLGLPSIHDKDGYWRPFFAACDETDTVICMHVGSSSSQTKTSDDAPNSVGLATITVNSLMSLSDWLCSGLLATYPSLRLAYSESQVGWMPYLLGRLDSIWRKGNKFTSMSSMDRAPSEYFAGRVYGCVFEDDFGLKVRHDVGIDQITFETDYPHQDTTWPNTLAYCERVFDGVPDDEVYKILRGNAIDMLGLPVELEYAGAA
jgi:predicted TIM-barrel fold metal-dependent hydrolase